MKHRLNDTRFRKLIHGFTLIELLVVIAIIALLLSISLPSFRKVKEMSSMVNCLTNHKNLAVAFMMYADENKGNFCSGYVDTNVNKVNPPRWVNAPLAYDASGNQIYKGNSADLSLEHRLNGIREGALYPYLNSTEMFHCPGDRRMVRGTSNMTQVYRSYGMPDYYWARGTIGGVANETKLSRVSGSKMLFVEDQYDGYYNIDGWSYVPRSQSLWDPLGNYHNKSCTFSFVDGRAENYKWKDERTMIFMSDRPLAASRGFGKGAVFQPYNYDLDWLDANYPGKTRLKGGN